MRALPEGEKEYSFCKQRKITPLLQKTIPKIEKRKEKHNTQKIILNLGKRKLELFLSCNAKEKTNA